MTRESVLSKLLLQSSTWKDFLTVTHRNMPEGFSCWLLQMGVLYRNMLLHRLASSRWPALWAVQMSSRWIWGGDLICVYPTSCRNPVVDSCFLALPVSFIEWKTPAPTHINFAASPPPKKQGKESGLRRENKIPTWTAKGKRKLLTHKSYIKLFHMTSYTLSPSASFFLKSTQICSFFSPYATKALPSFRLKH